MFIFFHKKMFLLHDRPVSYLNRTFRFGFIYNKYKRIRLKAAINKKTPKKIFNGVLTNIMKDFSIE